MKGFGEGGGSQHNMDVCEMQRRCLGGGWGEASGCLCVSSAYFSANPAAALHLMGGWVGGGGAGVFAFMWWILSSKTL